MKKLTVLLTVLIMASVLVMSACDSEPSYTEDTTADTTVAEETTTASADDTTAEPEETTEPAPEKVTYTVTVKDQDGNPVADVEVQMCSDAGCRLPTPTDENGVATFTYEADNYHITIIGCPEGYTADATEEHYFAEDSTELTVTITRD